MYLLISLFPIHMCMYCSQRRDSDIIIIERTMNGDGIWNCITLYFFYGCTEDNYGNYCKSDGSVKVVQCVRLYAWMDFCIIVVVASYAKCVCDWLPVRARWKYWFYRIWHDTYWLLSFPFFVSLFTCISISFSSFLYLSYCVYCVLSISISNSLESRFLTQFLS